MSNERLQNALALIDAANAEDPERELHEGVEQPKSLLYGQRMSAWLERLCPEAPESLRLAVRAQHIRRWRIPRDRYPQGRIGYLQWRKDLMKYHAEQAGALLEQADYSADVIERVQSLLKKERIKQDPDAQTLEDVACLVFLSHYFTDFAGAYDDDKLVDILRKTWRKMSPRGHEAALALDLDERTQRLVGRALSDEGRA